MVRFATAQLRAGHLPLSSWFPFLGEGSPQFLHYQSLPAMVTGVVGLATGPDVAFRWSLYLLLSLWPVSVYLSARAFGCGRPAAAASAAMAPFLVSITGVGYEQHAYLPAGFGVWTQLWASWTLPLAWGWSWRAIRDGRGYFAAVLLTALTVALHFETGYLALAVLLIWPLIAGRPLVARLRRAAVLLGGSLLASAWVIVPLVAQRKWAAVNEPLRGTGLVNGYGARQVLDWLVTGQLLDHGRLPVVTVFAALGLVMAWLAWSSDPGGRALLAALAVCLLFAFGRTTFGSLADVIPGGADLFFRRFMMGVQLCALLLAGRGAVWLAAGGVRLFQARVPRWPPGLTPAVMLVAAIAVLAPAWLQLGSYDRHDGAAITAQRHADSTEGGRRRSPHRGDRTRRGRADLRGDAVEPGPGLHRRGSTRVQVPGEPRRRRGRLHPAHGVADDRPGVLLRRPGPIGLPAVRDPLPHPARREKAAGTRAADPALRPLLPMDDQRRRLHPGRQSSAPSRRTGQTSAPAAFRCCTPGSPRTAPTSVSSTGLRAAGMAACRRRHASPRPVRSARNAPI